MALTKANKYMFEVVLRATKGKIVDELKDIYNVDAIEITTSILPGKPKRITGTSRFYKSDKRKKAIVTLKKGQKIELFEESKK